MTDGRSERVRRVLAGVLRQAVSDANTPHVSIPGSGADAEFVRALAAATLGPDAIQPTGLRLHPANKTTLLLSGAPPADILLLGDLYYSQVVELAGSASLPAEVAELAIACGGAERLDRILGRLYDHRDEWATAVADLTLPAQERLRQVLASARFRRARIGLVPKLGARTLGIDLYA